MSILLNSMESLYILYAIQGRQLLLLLTQYYKDVLFLLCEV